MDKPRDKDKAEFLKEFGANMMEVYSKTLDEALKEVWANEWKHMRSGKCLLSQAEKAIQDVKVAFEQRRQYASKSPIMVVDVGETEILWATRKWYSDGLSPATINKRLNCLSKLGVSVEGLKVNNPPKLKWWLKPEDYKNVIAHLSGSPMKFHLRKNLVRDFIIWTCHTGLRVEESLRLKWSDIEWVVDNEIQYASAMTVPGLKTHDAQATLPLGGVAGAVLAKRSNFADYDADTNPTDLIFPITYEELHAEWQKVRKVFGWENEPTATLKALRRNAARYLHVDCGMPLDMVRQYLRHENIETTMGYLRLTGGYGTEEMRRYLK